MGDPGAPGANRGALVVLAFDTAGSACSVAVGRGELVLAHERREMRHGHAEALLPMIDRVMAAAGVVPPPHHILARSAGPGGVTRHPTGPSAPARLGVGAGARRPGAA